MNANQFQDDFFWTGAEDGAVCRYSLATNLYEDNLVRSSLPIRDIALSPDGRLAVIASEYVSPISHRRECLQTNSEVTVKVVHTEDALNILHLDDHPKPVKHVTFDPSGTFLALSCTDGVIYIYSFSNEEPKLVRKVEGVIPRLETDAIATSRAVWHPDGRAFAVVTGAREIQVISVGDGEKQKVFATGHLGDITTLAWSPNGALLVSAGGDGTIILWQTKTQKVLAR